MKNHENPFIRERKATLKIIYEQVKTHRITIFINNLNLIKFHRRRLPLLYLK